MKDLLIAKGYNQGKGSSFRSSGKIFTLPSVEVLAASSNIATIQELRRQYILPSPTTEESSALSTSSIKAHFISPAPFKGFLRGLDNDSVGMYPMEDEHGNVINALIAWPILPARRGHQGRRRRPFQESRCDRYPCRSRQEEWMPPIQSLLYKVHSSITRQRRSSAMRFLGRGIQAVVERGESLRRDLQIHQRRRLRSGCSRRQQSGEGREAPTRPCRLSTIRTYSRKKGRAELRSNCS